MMVKSTQISRRTDLAIMNLSAGETLNRRTEEVLAKYVSIDPGCSMACEAFSWSEDAAEANDLLDYIEEYVGQVCVVRGGADANWKSRHQVTIGEEDEAVTVWASDWREAACKAFLLHENGFRGNYALPAGKESEVNG